MRAHYATILADPVLRLAALGSLLFGCIVASLGPFQSLIAVTEFGLSDSGYAAVLIGVLVVSVLVSVGIGILTDQRPSRRVMALVACWGYLGAATLVWLLPARGSFIIAHVLLIPLGGTLFGQVLAIARLASQRLPAADRPGVLSIIRAAMAVPFVVLLPIWGVAADRGMDLVTIYPGIAAFGAIMLVVVWRHWPRDADAPWVEIKSGLGFRASLAEMLSPAVLIRVQLFGIMQAGGALGAVLTGLAFAAAGRPHGDVGLFFAIFVSIEVLGTLLIGPLLRVASRMTLVATGVVLYAVYLVLLAPLAYGPFVWLLVLPAGAGGALIYTLAITYLADLLGTRAGAGASLLALQRIGQDLASAGSFWAGTVIGGYALAGALGAALTMTALATILMLDRRRAG